MDFYTESCNVFLFEFTGQVALDEGSLALGLACGLEIFERIVCRAVQVALGGCTCNITSESSPYLACSSITDQDELEGGGGCRSFSHGGCCLVVD